MATHVLETGNAAITYDVEGEGGRPLMMIGQPMDASGFTALRAQFPDRKVITYDPRGIGRSTRSDGRTDNTPEQQAADVHAVIEAVGGPVDLFASSGGAVTALELVAAYPDDVVTLVAHEPPIIDVLPDAPAARRARDAFIAAYQAGGWGAGMAAFMQMSSWQGEYTDEYFALPAPDPGQFGVPAEDDGKRDDPLLGTASLPITDYYPRVDELKAAPTRVVIAVGEETGNAFTARTAVHTAKLLGDEAVVFPSHHGGFLGGEFGYAGKPEEFGVKLREVLG
ncbi:Pimeloyl-ACP methyl ester carboxylesterase [Lentzea xinjiangensis]|uniref:Pimeloyl-ACP methyl ester carboxylesterase n=1 Tax=Lentzea xinjiangensis TaxID=402600 RepID=A0A1H9LXA9_9PSEU|nr:alpha/beta hydrolase [Lentzea xinjiangensis]SER16008.1 Pimeloyl-ACP methyl ester carboxylesterase [Lentzea xinjiangensis]